MKINLTPNFTLQEFNSRDGSPMPADVRANVEKLAQQLQVIRDHIKVPITINSGYRSPAHNAKVGGAKNSYHVKGMAADLRAKGLTPSQLAATITALIIEGKITPGGVGLYPGFVHYDIRGTHNRFK